MTAQHELSAGVIPFRRDDRGALVFLILHSATVRNPRARWEFPKGGMEAGETPKQTAAREFVEETGLHHWHFLDGFERSLSYTYVRRGRKVLKTVTYYLVEVDDQSDPVQSAEHVADNAGYWCRWGQFDEINRLLFHAKIRQVFAEAHALLTGQAPPPGSNGTTAATPAAEESGSAG